MSGTYAKLMLFVLCVGNIFVDCRDTENSLGSKPVDIVVLSAPVLAPPKNSRAIVTETAKDFPSLMVIATDNNMINKADKETEANEMLSQEMQPIYYVKKLEEKNRYISMKHRKRIPLLGLRLYE